MEMRVDTLESDVQKVTLVGPFDIKGAADIELQLAALCGAKNQILVDLSAVPILASIGIRSLITNAKAVHRRGGRFIIAAPQGMVMKVLETAGVVDLLPVHADVESALADFAD